MLKGLLIMNTRIADYLGLFIIFTFYVLYFTLSPSRENPFIIFTVILLILSLISILTSFEELFTTFNKNPLIFRACCITLILIGVFFLGFFVGISWSSSYPFLLWDYAAEVSAPCLMMLYFPATTLWRLAKKVEDSQIHQACMDSSK